MSDRRVAAWCQGFCDIFLYNKKCLGNTSKNIAKPIGLDLETIFWGGFERTRLSLLYFLIFSEDVGSSTDRPKKSKLPLKRAAY